MASEQTEARRARVQALWIRKDRDIAQQLIEEGYAGEEKQSPDARRRQLATMIRNVWNDRAALRKMWREQKRMTHEDASETRGEYLAILDAYRDMGIEKITAGNLKGTPFAQTLMALARITEARGKATGVGEMDAPDEGGKKLPVLGLLIGTKGVSKDMREQLRAQGVEIGDDE